MSLRLSRVSQRPIPVRDKDGEYRVSVTVQGDGELPVLFINGIGDTQDAWDAVRKIQPAGTTFITYNRAGIGDSNTRGKSDQRPNPGRSRSYMELADEAQQVVDGVRRELSLSLGPPIVVGHSFGGDIARAFALKYRRRVSGLLLVDGSTDKVLGEHAHNALGFQDGHVPDNAQVEDQGAQFPPEATWIDTNKGVEELAYNSYPRVPILEVARNPWWSWEHGVDISRKQENENLATGREDDFSALYQKYLHDCLQWTVHQLIQASILRAPYVGVTRRESGSGSVKVGHRIHVESPATVISALDLVVKAVQNGQNYVRDDDVWNAYVKAKPDDKYPCTVLSEHQVATALAVVPNELLRPIQVGEPVEISIDVRWMLANYPPFSELDYQKDRPRYPTDLQRPTPLVTPKPRPVIYGPQPGAAGIRRACAR